MIAITPLPWILKRATVTRLFCVRGAVQHQLRRGLHQCGGGAVRPCPGEVWAHHHAAVQRGAGTGLHHCSGAGVQGNCGVYLNWKAVLTFLIRMFLASNAIPCTRMNVAGCLRRNHRILREVPWLAHPGVSLCAPGELRLGTAPGVRDCRHPAVPRHSAPSCLGPKPASSPTASAPLPTTRSATRSLSR